MIVIFSVINDSTTIEVTSWLRFYDVNYKVIYPEEFLAGININNLSLTNINTYIEEKIGCKMNEISIIWCRKWSSRLCHHPSIIKSIDFESNIKIVESNTKEMKLISELLFSFLPQNKVINNFYNKKKTKLFQLLTAQSMRIPIPQTHILSSKEKLKNLLGLENNKEVSLITKAIDETFSISDKQRSYTAFTARIPIKEVDSEIFMPSLVQKEIIKRYEVRSFVLDNDFFSVARFSQQNSQTKIDFRNYDKKNPNKTAKYRLPQKFKDKILKLFTKLNIRMGSVDIIVDERGDHIFLEINPYGQFGAESKICNFNLEERVAKYLIDYEEDYK